MGIFKRLSSTLRHPIITNATWLMGGRVFRYGLGALVTFLVARYLGPQNYGVLNYIIALISLAEPFATLGLSAVLTRQLISDPSAADRILGTAFWLRTLSGASCLAILNVIVLYTKADEGTLILGLALLSLGRFLRGFEVIDFYFQSKVQAKYSVWAQSLTFLIASILRILLVTFHCSLFSFFVVQSLELVLEAIGLLWIFRRQGHSINLWKFDRALVSSLMKKSWPLALSGVAAMINLKIDQVMIGDMMSYHDVGLYSVASKLSEFWLFVPTAIVASAFPSILNSWHNDRSKYTEQLHRLLSLLGYIGIIVACVIQFSAHPIIETLYGSGYADAAPVLVIHIWGAVFIFMRTLVSKWLVAEEYYIFSLTTHGLGALVNVALNLWLIPKFGILGAAWATVISYATSSYLSLWVHSKTRPMALLMTRAICRPKLGAFRR